MASDTGKYQFPEGEREQEVLPNKLNITVPEEIGIKETEGFVRAETTLIEELTTESVFDCQYIRDIHRQALSHLYDFAGEYRSVNISKDGFLFTAAHVIPDAMKAFERDVLLTLPHGHSQREDLIHDIGKVHAELLFIHPFREGNGRTMRILANMMSYKAGYDMIDFKPVEEGGEMRKRYIKGVQAALEEDYEPMIDLIGELFPAG